MVKFYDPANEVVLNQVMDILEKGGIEFFLRREPEEGLGPQQIHLAEEDVAAAEELVRTAEREGRI